jgi:hypothetical protein
VSKVDEADTSFNFGHNTGESNLANARSPAKSNSLKWDEVGHEGSQPMRKK